MAKYRMTWEECVVLALGRLGSSASLPVLYREVAAVRRRARLGPLSTTYTATIRRVLQQSKRCAPVARAPGTWRLVGSRRDSAT